MLVEEKVEEIKEHLERAQNPIFYYDNDADGLCSFLILRRYLGRGKGVAVRSFPDLNASYARKAQELNADYVFVLDKPVLSKEFVESVKELGLPLVWIDHHDVEGENYGNDYENFYVYNPAREGGKSDEPVTSLVYNLTKRKEDMWIAIIGCIADHYLPGFAEEFAERYPEFWGNVNDPFDAYYKTEIGRIAIALNFGLKDSITHVVQLQNFLISCNSPNDVFQEVNSNYAFRKKYEYIKRKYDSFIEKAKNNVEGDFLFFEYSGDLSISSDIANELSYIYPDKYIVVAFKKGVVANISLRGKGVKRILEDVLKDFPDATGGGHEDAVGSRINVSELNRFKEALKARVTNN